MRERLAARLFLPGQLLAVSGVLFGVLFALVLLFGKPGLGIGYVFFLPVCLVALARGFKAGALAGLWATALHSVAMLFDDPRAVTFAPTSIRLVGYCAVGAVVGYFAGEARGVLAQASSVFDDLLLLSERDGSTGVRAASSFERSLQSRIEGNEEFAVVLVEMRSRRSGTAEPDDGAALEVASELQMSPGVDEVARIGPSRIAAIASPRALGDLNSLQHRLSLNRLIVVSGGCLFPSDGTTVVELVAAAIDDLHGQGAVAAISPRE